MEIKIDQQQWQEMNKSEKAEYLSKNKPMEIKTQDIVTQDDCSKHKKDVAGISDMSELADLIGDLHYESLTSLLNNLALKINSDGVNDYNNGRKLLGEFLLECAEHQSRAADCITAAWQLSKHFMKS